jgi:hypothetical protein
MDGGSRQPANELFEQAVKDIDAAYTRLSQRLGWRFLMTPQSTLSAGAEVALLTQNPGAMRGNEYPRSTPSWEAGSAYVSESWEGRPAGRAALQIQVQQMFAWLGLNPDTTLSAFFIPFRSPSLKELTAKDESLEFSRSLWRGIFEQVRPRLVVCLGVEVEAAMISLWEEQLWSHEFSVGWGQQRAVLHVCRNRFLLRLPHLSRFKVFGREASMGPLSDIRAGLVKLGVLNHGH